MITEILSNIARPALIKLIESNSKKDMIYPIIKEIPTVLDKVSTTSHILAGVASAILKDNNNSNAINNIDQEPVQSHTYPMTTNIAHVNVPQVNIVHIPEVPEEVLLRQKILQKQDYTYFCNYNSK